MTAPNMPPEQQHQAEEHQHFNLSTWALKNQALVLYFIILTLIGGVLAYTHLGQSEDPPFTFKVMLIRGSWPGASAQEVEQQVTDRIEKKLQEIPSIDYTSSYSRPGESVVFIVIRDNTFSEKIPELWYQIRKKIGDIRHTFPSDLQSLTFNDEFSDVYGTMYAMTADGLNPQQLKRQAEWVRARLLKLPDVEKVDLFGEQPQKIIIEISNQKLTSLGISPAQLAQMLQQQNAVTGSGTFDAGPERIRINVSGRLQTLEDLRSFPIRAGNQNLTLGEIATIKRGYADPPAQRIHFNGHAALLIGVSMQQGGDVIALGKALQQTITSVQTQLPVGVQLQLVTSQPDIVQHSVQDFVHSLTEALIIVLAVSLLSLGWRTGIVVAVAIPIVLAGTFLLMDWFDIGLHKISLGALILALGLLVDDAIIAVEMMASKMEQGWERMQAASFAFTSTAMPMLTGTLVTVAGFLPIATAVSSTGEYTRSIFQVSAIALSLSWVAAVIVVPFLGYHLLPNAAQPTHSPNGLIQKFRHFLGLKERAESEASAHHHSIYETKFYQRLQGVVSWCVMHKGMVIIATIILFVLSMLSFGKVQQQFFPDSTRLEIVVDLRLAENASDQSTDAAVKKFEQWLQQWQHTHAPLQNVVSYVGSGAPRYYLPLDVQLPHRAFAQLVILCKDLQQREALRNDLLTLFESDFPQLRASILRLENGPPVGFPVQYRVDGQNLQAIREVAHKIADVMRANPHLRNVQLGWEEPSKVIHVDIDQHKARLLGVSSPDIAQLLNTQYYEQVVSEFREGNERIDLVMRSPEEDHKKLSQLAQLTVLSQRGERVPLAQVADIHDGFEEGVIWRRNRVPSLTVRAHLRGNTQAPVVSTQITQAIQPLLQTLPAGVTVETGGAIEESAKGATSVAKGVPLFFAAVFTLLMLQLRSISNVLLVVLTAPLGMIGITFALLLFNMPFGFVAMLGSIALSGMIMRNSVILVDQIKQDIAEGASLEQAVIQSTVRRFRPIVLTAAAAILAMIPLTRSVFFGPMAVAIMGGLAVATVLTILFVPALYTFWAGLTSKASK
ncbi:MAG TPA: efflux RND transporter permease subunit [Methylophilus sp.]|uniref:efflux RND transporter permease subunit n=1 Tax=Methylophilus sp. TaxID=29541 RepID=UPI002CBFFEAC|nr:efflux RND transporter permease subunit [Methylophilus sp.]HSH85716.1 efflux RND transporter permease subunit [Methylophilus sp.]